MVTKTNAMRRLDALKIPYKEYEYFHSLSGIEVATELGENPKQVFKTLLTQAGPGLYYVFMLPVVCELDLKKAAVAVGKKALCMVKSKDLSGICGYVHGGCSPIGMKKNFVTTIDESAKNFDSIIFSGGRIGQQIETTLEGLAKAVDYKFADIVQN